MLARRALLVPQLLRSMSTEVTSRTATPRDDDLYRYLRLKCSGHEQAVLDSYEKFVKSAAEHLEIEYVTTEKPFRNISRRSMLGSRFVHKKYRAQYEIRTYYRDIVFRNLTGSTADTFLEYTQRNLPEGILMIAEKHRLATLPFELTAEQAQSEDKSIG